MSDHNGVILMASNIFAVSDVGNWIDFFDEIGTNIQTIAIPHIDLRYGERDSITVNTMNYTYRYRVHSENGKWVVTGSYKHRSNPLTNNDEHDDNDNIAFEFGDNTHGGGLEYFEFDRNGWGFSSGPTKLKLRNPDGTVAQYNAPLRGWYGGPDYSPFRNEPFGLVNDRRLFLPCGFNVYLDEISSVDIDTKESIG